MVPGSAQKGLKRKSQGGGRLGEVVARKALEQGGGFKEAMAIGKDHDVGIVKGGRAATEDRVVEARPQNPCDVTPVRS